MELLKTLQLIGSLGLSLVLREVASFRGAASNSEPEDHTQPRLEVLNELATTGLFKTSNFMCIQLPGGFANLESLVTLRGGRQGSTSLHKVKCYCGHTFRFRQGPLI